MCLFFLSFSHFCIFFLFFLLLHFFILHLFIFCSFFLLFFLLQEVIFLTVNHRRPLPLRELHSTGETIVWRDPGGSWACLWPVSNYEWINSPSQRLWHRYNVSSSSSFFLLFSFFFSFFFQQVVFLMVNHHGPLPLRELEPVYDLFTIMSELIHPAKDWHRHCVVFVQQVLFLMVNHRGPLPLRELHSTDEILAWRDPGGSWACLQPVPNYKWINSPCHRLWHRHNALSSFFFLFQ